MMFSWRSVEILYAKLISSVPLKYKPSIVVIQFPERLLMIYFFFI